MSARLVAFNAFKVSRLYLFGGITCAYPVYTSVAAAPLISHPTALYLFLLHIIGLLQACLSPT